MMREENFQPSAETLREEEAALVSRCQAGESAAFGELVTRYRNKVFAAIYILARDEQEAWDLSQEAFLKAWRNIAKFKGDSSFYTWVYRIGMNVTIDRLRKKQIQSGVEFDDTLGLKGVDPASSTTPQPQPAPYQKMQAGEVQTRIDAAMEQLSPDHRLVIFLREIEGQSYEEIAQTAGCSVGTVMSRLFYARKKLQTLLQDVYEAI